MQSNIKTKLKQQTGYLTLVVYFALTLSIFLVFWQVRDFDFVNYDDNIYIYENQHVLNGLTWESVKWATTTAHASFWHPMTWLSLMLDCELFGPEARGFHLVNVLLHLANTLLLFAVLKKMSGSLWPSAFVAAAFAIHPMHVESVAWVAERKDVLSTFFMMLTLAVYAGYVKRPSLLRYMLSLVFFALGLMAKPMLITLPFVLLLLDYWPLERIKFSAGDIAADNKKINLPWSKVILEKIPFLALSLVFSIITFVTQQKGGGLVDVTANPLGERIGNVLFSYSAYIGRLFWPVNLAVHYPIEALAAIPLWKYVLYALLLAGVTLLVLYFGRSRKYLPVGWFWFVGMLIPVIGIIQFTGSSYADRFTYITYTGLFIMTAWYVPEVLLKMPYRKEFLGVSMGIILGAFGICSYRQVSIWKDSFTLFTHALKVTQNNYVAYNNLGSAYGGLGRTQDEIESYEQAIRIKPDYANPYNNLGVVYNSLGRYEEAIEAYQVTIMLKPEYGGAYNNLGNAYSNLGRFQDAVDAYRHAITIKPDNGEAYNNLGTAYNNLGRYHDAVDSYEKAVVIKPDYADAYNNLGTSYGSLGRFHDAIDAYKQAIVINADYADAYNNLGSAYGSLGRYQEALEAYKQAIRVKADHYDARNNLGVAYSSLGRSEEAIDTFKEAIGIKPDDADAYNNLGITYGSLGRHGEAVEVYKQAIRVNPDYADAWYNLGTAYGGLGRYQEAIEAFKEAIRINPADAYSHNNLGIAYLKIGDKASALAEYKILKTLNAEMADRLFNIINRIKITR